MAPIAGIPARHRLHSAGDAFRIGQERLEAISYLPWGQRRSAEVIQGAGTNTYMNEVGPWVCQCYREGLFEAIGIVGEGGAGIATGQGDAGEIDAWRYRRLAPRRVMDAVVENDMDQIIWTHRPDRGKGAKLHQGGAVAVEHNYGPGGIQRHTQAHRPRAG